MWGGTSKQFFYCLCAKQRLENSYDSDYRGWQPFQTGDGLENKWISVFRVGVEGGGLSTAKKKGTDGVITVPALSGCILPSNLFSRDGAISQK